MNNPLLTETLGVYFLNMDTAVEEEAVSYTHLTLPTTSQV